MNISSSNEIRVYEFKFNGSWVRNSYEKTSFKKNNLQIGVTNSQLYLGPSCYFHYQS